MIDLEALEKEALKPEPNKPKLGAYIAVLLEVLMVAEFINLHSWTGIILAILYAWFSATWSLFAGILKPDD